MLIVLTGPSVIQHMLTAQLRELETDGLLARTVYPEVQPRVAYEITDDARNLKPVLDAIQAWALDRQAKKSAGV